MTPRRWNWSTIWEFLSPDVWIALAVIAFLLFIVLPWMAQQGH